jgi:hypothetical protein
VVDVITRVYAVILLLHGLNDFMMIVNTFNTPIIEGCLRCKIRRKASQKIQECATAMRWLHRAMNITSNIYIFQVPNRVLSLLTPSKDPKALLGLAQLVHSVTTYSSRMSSG